MSAIANNSSGPAGIEEKYEKLLDLCVHAFEGAHWNGELDARKKWLIEFLYDEGLVEIKNDVVTIVPARVETTDSGQQALSL